MNSHYKDKSYHHDGNCHTRKYGLYIEMGSCFWHTGSHKKAYWFPTYFSRNHAISRGLSNAWVGLVRVYGRYLWVDGTESAIANLPSLNERRKCMQISTTNGFITRDCDTDTALYVCDTALSPSPGRYMLTSSHGNIFCIIAHLWGKLPAHSCHKCCRCILITKVNKFRFWCLLHR